MFRAGYQRSSIAYLVGHPFIHTVIKLSWNFSKILNNVKEQKYSKKYERSQKKHIIHLTTKKYHQ